MMAVVDVYFLCLCRLDTRLNLLQTLSVIRLDGDGMDAVGVD